jgi:hemoglobin
MALRGGRRSLRVRGHQARTHALGLEEAHRALRIDSDEFDEVAAELKRSLEFFNVSARETDEVLAAFAAQKAEVTEGSKVTA